MVRAVVSWQDRVPERDGVAPSVYDVCFKPDGSQLVAAVGTRVLVYDAASGELLTVSLRVPLGVRLASSRCDKLGCELQPVVGEMRPQGAVRRVTWSAKKKAQPADRLDI